MEIWKQKDREAVTETGKVQKIRGVLGKKNYLENRIAWAPDCVQQLVFIKSSQLQSELKAVDKQIV